MLVVAAPPASTSTLVSVALSATWDKDGDKDGEDVILEGDVAGVVVDVEDYGCSITGGCKVEGVSTMGVCWDAARIADPSPRPV
ncbi:hypothetical protein Tco_1449190 [Tanacetum coccineum]